MVTDLSEILRSIEMPLREGEVKAYMIMLLRGDLKPANLLIDCKGILKIADFGLARLFSSEENKLYSHQVVSRSRAPLWCKAGENDIEQLWLVIRVLGTPTEKSWPGLTQLPDYNKITFTRCDPVALEDILLSASPLAQNLLGKFLRYDQSRRISAQKALLHNFFLTEPLPVDHRNLPKPNTRRSVATTLESCLKAPLNTLIPPPSFFDETTKYLQLSDNSDPQK
ncbi:Cyclin-dependent kinase 20 [Taenia crassiceps]|uniref:Cyclin-dependent kinase 20 n=1 Tax=Taenia crassiceps TaxID=6207 RepID=A0ABR4QH51_9CEST